MWPSQESCGGIRWFERPLGSRQGGGLNPPTKDSATTCFSNGAFMLEQEWGTLLPPQNPLLGLDFFLL